MMNIEKFWKQVSEPNENSCTLWLGWKNSQGYGTFKWKKNKLSAHRAAFEIAHGREPKKKHIISASCGERSCVNVEHLEELPRDHKWLDIMEKGFNLCNYCKENKPLTDFGIKGKKYSTKCKKCANKYNKKYYKNNKEKRIKQIYYDRKSNPLMKYGGTAIDYEKIISSQNNICAICGEDKPLVVDHCHVCGLYNIKAVRGLLCAKCNSHGSFTLENPNGLLTKAKEYALIHWNKYH